LHGQWADADRGAQGRQVAQLPRSPRCREYSNRESPDMPPSALPRGVPQEDSGHGEDTMRVSVICLLLLLSAAVVSRERLPASAPVYRCGQATTVRYQDVPCVHGEQSTRWHPPPGRPSPARRPAATVGAAPPASPRRRAGRDGVHRGPAAALITLQQDPEGCSRVKRLREASMGRRRRPADYLAERAWEDRVRDACR